jgi:beta-galactosidase
MKSANHSGSTHHHGTSVGRAGLLLAASVAAVVLQTGAVMAADGPRERVSINNDWRFTKGDPPGMTTNLTLLAQRAGGRGGAAGGGQAANDELWPFILASSNDFIKDPAKRYAPTGTFDASGAPYAAAGFNDSGWRQLDLPHDFGVESPFLAPGQPGSNGSTGRLPFFGQVWYRKALTIPAGDAGKQFYLDVDGAMSYAIVFCNGKLVGGWPYGYSSWRLDLTPYVTPGGNNTLAIRLDNPPNSSRWYPGGGIYRNVWLTKTAPVAVAQWGTFITTPDASAASSGVVLSVTVDNKSKADATVSVATQIFALDAAGERAGAAVAALPAVNGQVAAGKSATVENKGTVANPKLWSTKSPNRYVAVTTVTQNGNVVDAYETAFGIRTVKFDPNAGMSINGETLKMNGVCDHHDLGALGSAVNFRALQRQLEILHDMGCNAIRTSHNPPAPELLELADRMGFVVMDETFDTWRGTKSPNDYGRVFAQWHEQDTRMLVRRDRNHPSVVMWSIGNEIGEQGQGQAGADVAIELGKYVHEEDPTRPITSAMNNARAGSPFATAMDILGLNYQGSRLPTPQYPSFKQSFPDKFVYGSETASTISSRGDYYFPVANFPGSTGGGRDNAAHQMSSYDLYYPSWATSPDTEFLSQDAFPYVGGEFVWTGFDYIGEPTPWGGGNDPSRSSYFGIIDLAGFPKDRFYIYQAKWRPDFPMAHILPHWNWPDRAGQVTPVHVYTSGDEAELFLNGKSQGRKKKVFEGVNGTIAGKPINGMPAYRIRWDEVVYEPGELKVVAYKNGKEWATETMKTTGAAAKLLLKPDRATIAGDGHDLSFVTLTVADAAGLMVPRSKNAITFEIAGPGEIVATDNGDATDLSVFASKERKAYNGLALAIVKAKRGQPGVITLTAKSEGLTAATTTINLK